MKFVVYVIVRVEKKKIANGFVCKECLHLCSIRFQVKINKHTTREEILIEIENNKNYKNLLANFTTTKKIGKYIEFDEQKRLWLIPDGPILNKVEPKIYSFDDIVEYQLLEDGNNVTRIDRVSGRVITKSVINSLRIKITVNQTDNPIVYINLMDTAAKSDSFRYKESYSLAQEILSMLSIITQKSRDENQNNKISVADELIKLKGLLDEGILTQEEFINEKNKILNK
ncbi:SHOCT domain-containing protein [Clostridium lundense]|uniref:SHOCT domain-containing protein n=1 Tax=Clostridium lundense TaxID=319475 RepID=UPI001FA7DD0C|nr:SHOCT domain-containing protein [Clostridium lundense]